MLCTLTGVGSCPDKRRTSPSTVSGGGANPPLPQPPPFAAAAAGGDGAAGCGLAVLPYADPAPLPYADPVPLPYADPAPLPPWLPLPPAAGNASAAGAGLPWYARASVLTSGRWTKLPGHSWRLKFSDSMRHKGGVTLGTASPPAKR
ncbi:hypothetical protein TSOC_007740 [Tetrabaena socialis]|uniref:Uncharacterized protein n=1 Tax=Tetrabaena socialis TaxID=47790 RepID=A0A2J8A0A3_9CHLO|nr:hypothetical protein TSOC_007740 [Tetrabaena socialis]|eukprot:PNH05952.1 hypothetical protein TSOC_007740 [Tetrabaena socialis]